MARRKVTVRDIGEILDHWQSGRGIKAVATRSGSREMGWLPPPPRDRHYSLIGGCGE